jgi:8-oxo-dGTP pyrophosphatase MutT (NUDIX family)
MDDEVVDIVDETGTVLRQAKKTDAHKHGWLHKTVIGYLRDGDDWRLVRQTPDRQDAGQLVAPVGGHVRVGENEIEALLRESEEEIGTRNITYKPVGQVIFHRQVIGRDENHLFFIYKISTTDPVMLGDEAESIETFTKEKLKDSLIKRPADFGDPFYFVLEKFYPDYLPTNWQRHWD